MLDARLQLDVIACTASMRACERGRQWRRVLSLLDAAFAAGLQPDAAAHGAATHGLATGAEGRWLLALGALRDMRRRGVEVGGAAYCSGMSACGKARRWPLSLLLLQRSRLGGLEASVVLYSNAINACGGSKCWALAAETLRAMRRRRLDPNRVTYNAAAGACGAAGEGGPLEALLGEMEERSLRPDAVTLNGAMTACEVSDWQRSAMLLEGLPARGLRADVISYSTVMNLLGKGQLWAEALNLFSKAKRERQRLNDVAYCTVISACSQGHQWELVLDLIRQMRSRGMQLSMFACSAAMSVFEKCQRWQWALTLLHELQEARAQLNVVACSAAISAFEKGQQWWRALGLLKEMQALVLQPDTIAFSSAISAAEKGGQWERALEVLRQALASGAELDAIAYNAAASALENGQQWEAALSLLREMQGRSVAPDLVTYCAVVSACEKGLQWGLALDLLQEMRAESLPPDVFACSAAVSACGACGRWEAALHLLDDMRQAAIEAQAITYNAAISACERGGQWQRAIELLGALPRLGLRQDVIGFNAAILACLRCRRWPCALQLFSGMATCGLRPDMQGYRLLLTEAEQRGHPKREAALLTEVRDALFPGPDSPVRVRLLDGRVEEEERVASATLSSKGSLPLSGRASDPLCWLSQGPRSPSTSSGLAPGPASARVDPGAPYAKELRLLSHVLATAVAGDPSSVCDAVEQYGDGVLRGASWLKIAGGAKTEALTAAVRAAPPSPAAVLEIGAYCGYSALRLSVAVPGVRVASLEVDPAHVLIARNVIAFAGLSRDLDVLTGHSKDLLPRLARRYRSKGSAAAFSAAFMDQRGSLYHGDLAALEAQGLLRLPGAVVVADNVLKPGAPLFLRRTTAGGGAYESQVVSMEEFAMRGAVEDWMSVVVALKGGRPPAQEGEEDDEAFEPELLQMDREADRIREKAMNSGKGLSFSEWATFASDARDRLAHLGIRSSAEAAEP